MAKRKKDPPTRQPADRSVRQQSVRQQDAAASYRARLSAKKAAALQTSTGRWSPGLRDRLDLAFARLLQLATAPKGRRSGLRERFLERRVFSAATRRAAPRNAIYRTSRAVLSAAKSGDPAVFKTARNELYRLWREARADRPVSTRHR